MLSAPCRAPTADSLAIESAWAAKARELYLAIGVTSYRVHDFRGEYATQHNERTGTDRLLRRSQAAHAMASPRSQYADEVCARNAARMETHRAALDPNGA